MDPVGVAIEAAQAILALCVLFILPGMALGPVILPGAPTPLHVLGRATGLSLLIVSASCIVLAGLGQLHAPTILATIAVVTIVPLTSRAARESVARVVSTRRRRRRWWLGAVAGILVLWAIVIQPSRAVVGESLLPRTSTPWYYMALAREVEEAGAIPATVSEWGQERAFPTDYLPATVHAAAALALLPGDLVVAVAWYRLAILLAAAILTALLLRRWFSTWIAVLGACLLLSTVRLEAKFLDLRPETFGLVLALFCVWLADRAMADRSRRSLLVAAAAAVATFLSHAEVFLLLGPALAGIAAGRAIVAVGRRRGSRSRFGLRWPRRRDLRPAVVAGAILVSGLVVGSGLNAVFAGEFRLIGYVATARAEVAPVPAERVPEGWSFSGDPTWDFNVAAVSPRLVGEPPPRSFTSSSMLPRSIVFVWPGLDGRGRGDLVTLAGLVLAPLLAWPWLDPRRRRFLVSWWVFGVGLLVGSWLLFRISSTYVPARVGPRRLMPYEQLVPVMSAVLVLFVGDRLLRTGWRRLFPRRGAMVAAGVALALVTIGAAAPAPPSVFGDDTDEAALSPVGSEALRWIDANLPSDVRLLTNAYTDGSMLAMARRPAILDGRAVYLEDAAFLGESTSLVLGARVFFADPTGDAARRYLEDEHVTHLLVATAGPAGTDLGGYGLFDTNLAALAGSGRYTQVRSFGDGRLLLYRVTAGS